MTHPSLAPHGMKPDNRESVAQADEIAALRAENERLRSLIAWCRPRLRLVAYQDALDQYVTNPQAADHVPLVQSAPIKGDK